MKRVLTALSMVTLIGCGAESDANLSAHHAETLQSRTLGDGEYIVTVSRPELCSPSEINLVKSYRLQAFIPEVSVAEGTAVVDNLIRAAVCIGGEVHASFYSTMGTTHNVNAFDLSIAKIERIIEMKQIRAHKNLQAGRYLINLERQGGCRDSKINIEKSLRYNERGPLELQVIELKAGDQVLDDLVRPSVCRSPSTESGQVLVEVPSDHVSLNLKDGLKVTKIQEITRTVEIKK